MSRSEIARLVSAVALAGVFAFEQRATAKPLEELWNSGYNIVVRPASDTITGGTLDVWVQNNTGGTLPNFALKVEGGMAVRKTITRDDHGFLLPGENAHFAVTTTATSVAGLKLGVKFGWHEEAGAYGTMAPPLVLQDNKCTLTPGTDPAMDFTKGTAAENSLRDAAKIDFGLDPVEATGVLLDRFCAGRATWQAGGVAPTIKGCRTQSYDACPAPPAAAEANQTQFDGLFGLAQLAIRKAAIRPEWLAPLRSRLQCATKDPNDAFAVMATFVLGYLGEDAKARAYLETLTKDAKQGAVAKAALLLMGNADDQTKYGADVRAGMTGATPSAAASMAALVIAAKDDATAAKLIKLSYWEDTDSNPLSLTASHLLAIAAWNQKRWAPKAHEGVAVSFYKDDQKTWPCVMPFSGAGGGGGGVDAGAAAADASATSPDAGVDGVSGAGGRGAAGSGGGPGTGGTGGGGGQANTPVMGGGAGNGVKGGAGGEPDSSSSGGRSGGAAASNNASGACSVSPYDAGSGWAFCLLTLLTLRRRLRLRAR